jgi:hypothetical protein
VVGYRLVKNLLLFPLAKYKDGKRKIGGGSDARQWHAAHALDSVTAAKSFGKASCKGRSKIKV